jgi:hypothetical protein
LQVGNQLETQLIHFSISGPNTEVNPIENNKKEYVTHCGLMSPKIIVIQWDQPTTRMLVERVPKSLKKAF